jgi:hypothetical protein
MTSLVLILACLAASPAVAADFASSFRTTHDRIWIGKDYWANPMEDWRVQGGRLECLSGGPDRNVHLLTRELGKKRGTLEMSVLCGLIDEGSAPGSVGFRVGIHDKEVNDHRTWLIYGKGLDVGVTTAGELFIGKERKKAPNAAGKLKEIELRLSISASTRRMRPNSDRW